MLRGSVQGVGGRNIATALKFLVALTFSLHHSTTYSSEPCKPKMAEPIKMPFGLRTRLGPRNNVLVGYPGPPWAMGTGNFEEGNVICCPSHDGNNGMLVPWLKCTMSITQNYKIQHH